MRKILNIPDRFCLNCGDKLPRLTPSQIRQGRGKFCSNACTNKGKHSHAWKETLTVKCIGDKAYNTLHTWVRRNKVMPNSCEKCGSKDKRQWANIDGKYRRDLKDFICLCVSCHRIHDISLRGFMNNQHGSYPLRESLSRPISKD